MPWGSPLKLLGRMKYIIIAITIQAIAIIMKPPLGSPSPPEKEVYESEANLFYFTCCIRAREAISKALIVCASALQGKKL